MPCTTIEHFGSETLVTATHFVSLSPLLPVKSVLSTLKKYDKTSQKTESIFYIYTYYHIISTKTYASADISYIYNRQFLSNNTKIRTYVIWVFCNL